jgi:hypothetical protein
MSFEVGPSFAPQTLPVVFKGDADFAIIGRFGVFIGHFQE